jgi:hypothetical protein
MRKYYGSMRSRRCGAGRSRNVQGSCYSPRFVQILMRHSPVCDGRGQRRIEAMSMRMPNGTKWQCACLQSLPEFSAWSGLARTGRPPPNAQSIPVRSFAQLVPMRLPAEMELLAGRPMRLNIPGAARRPRGDRAGKLHYGAGSALVTLALTIVLSATVSAPLKLISFR